jgi:hypothetical protein
VAHSHYGVARALDRVGCGPAAATYLRGIGERNERCRV